MITKTNTTDEQQDQQDQRDLRNSFHRTRIFKGIVSQMRANFPLSS